MAAGHGESENVTALDECENTLLLHDNGSLSDGDGSPNQQKTILQAPAWTTSALLLAYVMIWLVYFMEGLLSGVAGLLIPFVTSAFAKHSLTPMIGILSSVFGGITNLSLAKGLDASGRLQGLAFCIVLATVGLMLSTACNSIETFAAAQVFQTVGNNGIIYSLTVFVAETSSLRNQGLMQAIVISPNLVTCWLVGPVAGRLLTGPGWRWAFGIFAVLVPSVTLPFFVLQWRHNCVSAKLRLAVHGDDDLSEDVSYDILRCCRQFDIVGLLLLSIGIVLILLSLNMLASQKLESPAFLSMILAGSVCLVTLAIWESCYASTTLIPYSLLLDRTVLGACVLSATLFVSFWCWNSFFSSYLQVVNNLSIESTSYIIQLYTLCSVAGAMAVGAAIHYIGYFKPLCLYFGVPCSVCGLVLMMYYCYIKAGSGYIVVCQALVSTGAGSIMVCAQVAILAASSQHHVAVSLALLGIFGNIGGAIGQTISSMIWQSTFSRKLLEYLPADEIPNFPEIYSDISIQLSYPPGSSTRLAIQHAYGDAQFWMLAAGTVVWAAGLIAVMGWRSINVIGIGRE